MHTNTQTKKKSHTASLLCPSLNIKTHATVQFTVRKPQKQEIRTSYQSEPNKDFTDTHTHTHAQTHDPLSSRKWWNMKWSITAWNGSLPGTVLVLCHIVFYCQKKRETGEKEGKKQLTVQNKFDTLRFPSFLLFTIEIFCMETPRDFNSFRQLNLWFGNPHKPFICMRFGNKANNHPRK